MSHPGGRTCSRGSGKEFIESLRDASKKDYWILGTSEHAEETLADQDFSGKWVIVLGGEESGIRRLVSEKCDRMVKLEPAGELKSLNVGTAAAVLLSRVFSSRE